MLSWQSYAVSGSLAQYDDGKSSQSRRCVLIGLTPFAAPRYNPQDLSASGSAGFAP
jgi:hypothetical protein